MDLRPITQNQKAQYNKLVSHVIQSWEWGEFRKSLGTPVLRYGLYHNNKLSVVFQLTLHKIPLTNKYVGYLPKGPFPNQELAEALEQIGKEQSCAFIKTEPDVVIPVIPANARLPKTGTVGQAGIQLNNSTSRLLDQRFKPSPKPLFTKYNFVLDITKPESELLKNMHQKTRYNIRVAEKHGVKVEARTDNEAFEIYLKLYFETTERQGYHGHNKDYHRKVWETLKNAGMARILLATCRLPASQRGEPPTRFADSSKRATYHLTAWMLLNFQDTLYYPYGGSSKSHPEVMANNLVAWEAIKLGKKMGLKTFDMWGALEPDANPKDPWFGFHKFKQGYGGQLVKYIGTYDLILNWPIYWMFTIIDKLTPLKIFLLKLLRR